MKHKITVVLIGFLFLQLPLLAQTGQDWKPLTLNIDGTNNFNGVEAYYDLTTYNNNEYIVIQITNHNNYPVKACWNNVVLNSVNQKLNRETPQDSVVVRANSTVRGDCSNNSSFLAMKLTDFGILKEDFKAFMMSGFDFVIIH